MNPAPLPQPAPFTCPNCGAALETKPELCPHCGARLDGKGARLSTTHAIALIFGLMFFGAIGACGGTMVLGAFGKQSSDLSARDFLVISVPSLLFGLAGFVACLLPFFRRRK